MRTQTETQTNTPATPKQVVVTLTARDSAAPHKPAACHAPCLDAWDPSGAPKGPRRPALPAALAAQILQHPWAKTAHSRDAEKHVAATANRRWKRRAN